MTQPHDPLAAHQFQVPTSELRDVVAGDRLVLRGPEAHHAARVLRLTPGEPIRCADGAGHGVAAVIEDIGGPSEFGGGSRGLDSAVVVRVTRVLQAERTGPDLVLVQALAKAGRDEQAIEAATEIGVDAVLAWAAQRCVVRWRPQRAARSLDKWRNVVQAAAKQSRRLTVPAVAGPLSTADLAQRVTQAVNDGGAAYLLHPQADEPLAEQQLPDGGQVLVIVGPEGGITPQERDTLTAAGATTVRLGPTVLRSSTAGPAALAVLSAAGRWHARPQQGGGA